MSARFSTVNEFSPTGTVVPIGTSYSSAINVETSKDARAIVKVASTGGSATTLDIEVQISQDGTNWAPIRSFNQLLKAQIPKVAAEFLDTFEMSVYARLKYVVAGDTFTLGAKLEAKEG